MARRTGITVPHCQCRKKCVENGSRVCADNCSHPNRYQVRKRYWCDRADCKACDRAREKGSTKAPQHSHWFPTETEAKGFLVQLNVDAIRPKSADERSRMRLEDAFPSGARSIRSLSARTPPTCTGGSGGCIWNHRTEGFPSPNVPQ